MEHMEYMEHMEHMGHMEHMKGDLSFIFSFRWRDSVESVAFYYL